jgi:hypothetical protein
MSNLGDPRHYQHTSRATVPPSPRPAEHYRPGDFVTVVPGDEDAWLLHMQRHVNVVDEPTPNNYRVRLGATSADDAIQGPICAERLTPGWVDQDGVSRCDVRGRPTRWADRSLFNGGGLAQEDPAEDSVSAPVRFRRRTSQLQPRDVV